MNRELERLSVHHNIFNHHTTQRTATQFVTFHARLTRGERRNNIRCPNLLWTRHNNLISKIARPRLIGVMLQCRLLIPQTSPRIPRKRQTLGSRIFISSSSSFSHSLSRQKIKDFEPPNERPAVSNRCSNSNGDYYCNSRKGNVVPLNSASFNRSNLVAIRWTSTSTKTAPTTTGSLAENETFHICQEEIIQQAKIGNPQQAEFLLLDFLRKPIPSSIPSMVPVYNAILISWAESGSKEAPLRGQALIERIWKVYDEDSGRNSNVKPDVSNYNQLLMSLNSKHEGFEHQAEALLKEMKRRNVKPNAKTYFSALALLARAGRGKEAQEILEAAIQEYLDGNNDIRPSNVWFNSVMDAWAKSRSPDAPNRAGAVLSKMLELSDQLKTRPDVISYNILIDCWAKSSQKDAASRAEAVLRDLQEKRISGAQNLVPNAFSYTSVINAWARQGDASRAEAVLEEMYKDYQSGNELAKPEAVPFNSVLNAWARSRSPDAPDRAKSILSRMWELCDRFETRPDNVSYNILIDCWAKSGRKDSALQAEAVLRDVQKMHDSGVKDILPNAVIYTSVINAWAQNGDGPRAEALLEEMYEDYKNGNMSAKPTVQAYGAVLNAWARSGSPHAPDRAEAILSKLLELSDQFGCQPDATSFYAFIECWAKSNRKDASKRIEASLQDMRKRNINLDESIVSNIRPLCQRLEDPK